MPHRDVMVIRDTFILQPSGRMVNKGDVVHDPAEIAHIRAHHPEKATPSRHEHHEEPAPAAAEPAPVPHADAGITHHSA